MKTPMIAALLLAAAAAPVLAAQTFDQDASALLAQAKESAKKDKTVLSAVLGGGRRYEPACAEIKFAAGQPMTSAARPLTSAEMEDRCIPTGSGESCFPQQIGSRSLDVSVTLQNRPALQPGEVDKFEVCLTGPWLSTEVVSSAYEYKVVSDGSETGAVVLSAVKKKASAK